MTPDWLAVFAGYDDAALVALANAGLLRRARKDLAAGDVSLASESAAEVVVACGSAVVRLGPKGPVAASCSCPTAGVCQHVVAACLWARERMTGGTPGEPKPTDAVVDGASTTGRAPATDRATAPDALADLLALEPGVVCRAAGRPALRRVVERLPAALLAGLAQEGPGEPTACEVAADGARLTITWTDGTGALTQVVFVAPAGFAGMVVAGARSAGDQAAARLEAVVRVFAREGRSWPWPREIEAERSGELTTAQRAGIEEASAVVGHVVDAGLSHLGADAADTLRGAAARARLVGLLLLHRLLLVAAGLVDGLASRDDDVNEADALGALAEAWALAAALRDAPGGALPDLLGAPVRRATDVEPGDDLPGRLVPLGVRWWQAPSGARGLTLTAWDTRHRTLRTATVARPSGADPSFRRDVDLPLLWKASVAAVCAGPFELAEAELRPDGSLSTTSRTSLVPGGGFDVRDLQEIAQHLDGVTTGTVGFGRARRRVRLVMVRETGAVGVDEVRRDVTWPVTSADGVTHVLRVGVEHERSVEALLSVVASRKQVVAVLVERDASSGADEPVGVFLRTGQGSVELFSPSMSPVFRAVSWTALRRLRARIAALHRGSTVHVAEPVARGPVARVGEPALEVVDSLGATGRRRLTAHQQGVLSDRARLAHDLGMVTVGRTIESLAADVTTSTLLRARFVLGRAAALADT
ncbi:SWIM zinc finger family protein [Oerskovia turbata]|uniref:SWIM zinc finger family protein n=1 Tax=Oerskovia turbata TaxID=1713 RepID=A0A4Q1L363_9CELL|nr:SWIM zinc finger family protein [Oerskovia turbata]RXR26097.1 SWIM zinc finger family protein [Oerskovia turbata]RXR36599.1 SWIM zinc finger family protein [Oerskovia turbata]